MHFWICNEQNIKAVLDAAISTPTTKAEQKQKEVPRAVPYCENFLQTKKEHAINHLGSI